MKLLLLLIATVAIPSVLSHSWLGCVDYKIGSTRDSEYYNKDACKAFPRQYKNNHYAGGSWGAQTGYNYQPGGGNTCKYGLPQPYSSGYSNELPMAKYTAGQQVCIAWSSQNHVAAKCANIFIPDHGTKVYVSTANPGSDAKTNQMRLVKDFGRNMKPDERVGFQNCPKFCENNGNALCTGCFTVPSDLTPGTYTFVWSWAFNSASDVYTTCWEAQVGGGSGNPAPTPRPPTPNPTTPNPPNPTTPKPSNPTTPKPATPRPSSGGCSRYAHAHNPDNLWWVEVTGAKEGSNVKVTCSGRSEPVDCEWYAEGAKFRCAVAGSPCNHPRKVTVGSTTCDFPKSAFKDSAVADVDSFATADVDSFATSDADSFATTDVESFATADADVALATEVESLAVADAVESFATADSDVAEEEGTGDDDDGDDEAAAIAEVETEAEETEADDSGDDEEDDEEQEDDAEAYADFATADYAIAEETVGTTTAASDSIPAWGIALIVVGSVLLVGNLAATVFLALKNRESSVRE